MTIDETIEVLSVVMGRIEAQAEDCRKLYLNEIRIPLYTVPILIEALDGAIWRIKDMREGGGNE